MASIVFTDSLGTVTFTNGLDTIAAGVGSRFANWTPFQRPIGPAVVSLGTGARTQFRFRTDYGASFRIEEIPTARLGQALRLQAHLLSGGTVRVETDDLTDAIYPTCCLAPDGDVSIQMENRNDLTYSMNLSLINLDGEQMLCNYSSAVDAGLVLFAWDVSLGVSGGTFSRASSATFVADV